MDVTIRFTSDAYMVLEEASNKIREAQIQDEPIDPTFTLCLMRLIRLGGTVWKESDTMLICDAENGMTIGMHFDGKEWSLHS